MGRRGAAEFLGTALLVYFGVGVATLMFGFGVTSDFATGVIATAFAFGLVLAGLAYAIGPTSGCHVNPAVTLGFVVSGRMTLQEAGTYWGAQFAGGIAGALALWGTFAASPLYKRSTVGLGANGYGIHSHIGIHWWGAFIAEIVLTALFVGVILTVTSKVGQPVVAGLVIGLTLTLVHLMGISITGTSVNPARSLGSAIVVGSSALGQVWLFIVAPLVGGALAALLHRLLQSGTGAPAGAAD